MEKKEHDYEAILQKTALKDFLYLSDQRLKFIRFYITIVALIISALSIVLYKFNDLTVLVTSLFLEFFLIYISWIFMGIDTRNSELIKITQNALKAYEIKWTGNESDLCIFSKEEKSITPPIGTKIKMLFIGGITTAIFFILISTIKITIYIVCG